MKKLVTALAVTAALGLVPAVLPSTTFFPILTTYADGVVDHSETIQADGYGGMPAGMPVGRAKLMARRAAVVDAQRNLVETIKGTAVDAETIVNNYITQSDVVKTKVAGIVTGARVVSEEITSDGNYHVVMTVPMYGVGSVAEATLSTVMGNSTPTPIATPSSSYVPQSPVSATTTTVTTGTPATVPVATTTTTTTTTVPSQTTSATAPPAPAVAVNGGYTGLIIDARGYDMVRAFGPGIYDTNGRAIYTVHNVDESYAIQYGIVSYAEGNDAWNQAESGRVRAGSNPLIIKIAAPRKRVVNNCDVIVSPQDADRILAENQKTHFLEKCAVTFEI